MLATMIVDTLRATKWRIDHPGRKLALRSELPGARVFDPAADALKRARDAGVAMESRLALALPASWLVNSPAISHVLKRWALPPQRDVWLDLVAAVEAGRSTNLVCLVQRLGGEPYAVEAISKVLALLVPGAVPLMPAPACGFVLGDGAGTGATTFAAMIRWFGETVAKHRSGLAEIARAHPVVSLEPAQVLDRILWFDSEGYRHFPALAAS